MVRTLPALTLQTAAKLLTSYSKAASLPPAAALAGSHPFPHLSLKMATSTTAAAEAGPPAEGHGAHVETPTPQPGLGKLAADIMPHILNLYNCKATAADYEIYAPKATFQDPLMQAHGVKQIKSAFYSIPKVFKEASMVEYTVSEEESVPGSGEITIDNLQRYKLAGKTIDVVSLVKLQVENGKVVRHVDMWDKNPLLDRNTVKVPLVGRAIEKLRRGNMLITHLFMGFGKDPRARA